MYEPQFSNPPPERSILIEGGTWRDESTGRRYIWTGLPSFIGADGRRYQFREGSDKAELMPEAPRTLGDWAEAMTGAGMLVILVAFVVVLVGSAIFVAIDFLT
jgi:hypothetical protein